jgi:ATP-binding cassette subfamily B protein
MSPTPQDNALLDDDLLQEELAESQLQESGLKDLSLLKKLWPFIRPYRKALMLSLLMLPFITLSQMAQPFLVKTAVDGPIRQGDFHGLALLCVAFLVLLAIHYGLMYLQMNLAQVTGGRIIYSMRTHVYDHLQKLPPSFYQKHPIGKLVTRVTSDVESLSEMFSSGGIAILVDLVVIAGAVVGMFIMEWRLALFTCVLLPVLWFIMEFFRRRSRRAYDAIRVHVSRMNAYLQENISGMDVIHLYRREGKNFEDFKAMNHQTLKVSLDSVLYDSSLTAVVELLTHLTLVVILWYGGQFILQGEMTFGHLVAFFQFVQMIFNPIEDVSEKYTIIQSGLASIDKIVALLNEKPALPQPAQPVCLPRASGEITFEAVTFGYDPATPILKDVSFHIRSGQRIAVVGPSGAGKTTLIKLISRFYDPQQGTIRLDGHDLRSLDVADVRRNIVVIQQDDFLFSRSLAENITLRFYPPEGEEDPRLSEVLAMAHVADLAEALPQGVHTVLQERGRNLSSGERQLLLMARAMYHDPAVLVLDEATSAIDPHTETLVQETMERLMKGRTVLLIAHRLSTIRQADAIMVLDQGQLRETGSHQELLTQDGLYAKFHQYQQALETSTH